MRLYPRFLGVIAAAILGSLGVSSVVALISISKTGMPNNTSIKSITAVLTGKLALPLAPENISTIPLFQVHLNLWGTLLTAHGRNGVAKLVKINPEGTHLQFEILKDMKFSNGRQITSEDVRYSLERILSRQTHGHFNAKTVIHAVRPIDSSTLEIQLTQPTPSFLFLLSIPEMGIVPKEACDDQGNLINLSVTSGAYYIDEPPSEFGLILKKNLHYSSHTDASPDRVKLLFKAGAEDFRSAAEMPDTDFIEIFDNSGLEALPSIRQNHAYSEKATRPSLSYFLIADPDRLTLTQRRSISALIQAGFELRYSMDTALERRTFEILPPGTFGSLSLTQPLFTDYHQADLPKDLVIAFVNPDTPLAKTIVRTLQESGIQAQSVKLSESKGHDLLFWAQGMNSDFPEIELHLALLSTWASIKGTPRMKSDVILALHTPEMKRRKEVLQDVGRQLLEESMIVPLFVRSYVHAFKPDKIEIDEVTNYDGDVAFWKMKVK